MIIAINAVKEKIRRKELYVVTAIGLLILLGFSTGVGTISIGGVEITDYENLVPVLITVVNVICGALAIVLSLRTIPNEYERKTSHLIWIRGISQFRYHGELTLANAIISLFSEGILYLGVLIFMFMKGKGNEGWKLLPAFFIVAVSILLVSVFTSLLSVRLPSMAAGVIATICYLVGILHRILEVLEGMLSGFVSVLLKGVLWLIPDLHGIQSQASHFLTGETVDIHVILKGLLVIYLLTVCLYFLKKKEA